MTLDDAADLAQIATGLGALVVAALAFRARKTIAREQNRQAVLSTRANDSGEWKARCDTCSREASFGYYHV